jgi:hypothetical protein
MLLIPGILASKFTPQGDFESIATINVGSSGAATYSFTNIPQTYQHLQIRALLRANLASYVFTGLTFRVGNGSADSGSNYAYHRLYGNGASVSADSGANQSTMTSFYITANDAGANTFCANIVDILDYRDTNKFKTIRSLSGFDNNGSGSIYYDSGLWRSTSAINTLEFTIGGAGVTIRQHSQFALYGIKG